MKSLFTLHVVLHYMMKLAVITMIHRKIDQIDYRIKKFACLFERSILFTILLQKMSYILTPYPTFLPPSILQIDYRIKILKF